MLKRITKIRSSLTRITRVRWLVLANLVVVAVGSLLAFRYFEFATSMDLQDWLGIRMQGANERWFYFGSTLLVLGPMTAFPLYVKRYFQKRQCRECGRKHIQYF